MSNRLQIKCSWRSTFAQAVFCMSVLITRRGERCERPVKAKMIPPITQNPASLFVDGNWNWWGSEYYGNLIMECLTLVQWWRYCISSVILACLSFRGQMWQISQSTTYTARVICSTLVLVSGSKSNKITISVNDNFIVTLWLCQQNICSYLKHKVLSDIQIIEMLDSFQVGLSLLYLLPT